ncbi:MAG TPA: threonine synthase [Candidatus Hydrogenedentes bacterium]|nr:threonine synthase [Candidatus Hydrogenedentota bacterium]
MRIAGVIERYRAFMPVQDNTRVISLNEGSTPLIQAYKLSAAIHPKLEIWLKYEGLNPTGSFKDRGMTMAITKAVEDGFKVVMCASTGNTSASAAAYAARAGIKCAVLIPEGKIALGKLSQAMVHGAKVIQIKGNFDEALTLVRQICSKYPICLVNSINPFRIEGQKSGAFEIVDAFDGVAPDFQAMPVGNAGNITAYWKGYKEYKAAGKAANLPRMLGFQAAGSAPIVLGHPVAEPMTYATAIRIGNPASWKTAEEARDESNGVIGMVTDHQIKEAYKLLARTEGVFVEPASAASVAGIIKLSQNGFFDNVEPLYGEMIRLVCILTGHGLKDPDSAIAAAEQPATLEPNEEAILEVLGMLEPAFA